jgi:trimethylamine--corrinoid protein Co-methyltransferase
MMAHYGLPHAGTSGSGMGWGADLIAAGHLWTNQLLSCTGKAGLSPFIGDILGAMAFAPAVVVYANEIIEQVRLFARGFALDDHTVALDEIEQVGPGGDFLTSRQTLSLFRSASYRSEVLPNIGLEEWQARGRPQTGAALKHHTQQLLAQLDAPADHAALIARGEAFVRSRSST